MKILDQIPFEIDLPALFRRMRLEADAEYADDIRRLADAARPLARPRAIYEVAFIEGRKGRDEIRVGGARFVSRALRANLERVERVFPYIASCGPELDGLPVAADDFVGQFCRDTIKEMALHAAMAHVRAHVQETFALPKMAGMSPGSGDAHVWPIQQQKELFSIFGDVRSLIGVTLTDTFLMLPNKTVSGLFYPTEVDFVTCQLCHREVCPNRRAPFDQHQWELKFG